MWLIFVFHDGIEKYNQRKGKVHPPKLAGSKVGVFATRSPHRFNPIGLSLAKLDKVQGRTLFLSGIDLIHGTPILDIKPYHYKDVLPDFKPPAWIEETKRDPLQVGFDALAKEELSVLASKNGLDFYRDEAEVTELIVRVLEQNPLSVKAFEKTKTKEGGLYAVALDNLNIIYRMEKDQVTIVKVLYANSFSAIEHSKEWLQKLV